MGRSYPIHCADCKVVFKSSTRESDGTVKDLRKLAYRQGWTVNVPAWAMREEFGPEEGCRERRMDFCGSCMAKKAAEAMKARYAELEQALAEFDKNCKWAQATAARKATAARQATIENMDWAG